MRHGGQILVDQLKAQGVQRVFSVPGESFLAVLDGLYDSGIDNIVCRHEGGAAMMAEATGKLSQAPGVCFVTRGPGATNASAGVHVALQDGTPMILFVGQIARGDRDRGAFQEVDYRAMFGPLAKWVAEIDDPARIPEYVSRAFHVAQSGRPGPVVLALPEDVLSARCEVPDLPARAAPVSAVAPDELTAITQTLARAERPLVLVGGTIWDQTASDNLARFAERWGLPVAVAFRRQDHMDNRHPNYVGDLGVGMNPKLGERLREADCLLVLGARIADTTTNGYTLIDPAAPGKTIIHVHPDADLPGRVYRPDVTINRQADQVIAALAEAPVARQWAGWTAAARDEYESWQQPRETPGELKMEAVIAHLSKVLPEDAIVTNGAGNYAAFLHRYYRYKRAGTQLAPSSGSMGYGFPAAIAAAIAHPDRQVVCLAGDGDFQMTLNELSTAAQHGAKLVVIVANNGRYGTIRMHQEKTYPARVSGTDLANPDFAALARAYGGQGETVTETAAFPAALDRAMGADGVAVIELRLDPQALSTALTLDQTRALGEAGQR